MSHVLSSVFCMFTLHEAMLQTPADGSPRSLDESPTCMEGTSALQQVAGEYEM